MSGEERDEEAQEQSKLSRLVNTLVGTPTRAFGTLLSSTLVAGLSYMLVSSILETDGDEDSSKKKTTRTSSDLDVDRAATSASSDGSDEDGLFDLPDEGQSSRKKRNRNKKKRRGASSGKYEGAFTPHPSSSFSFPSGHGGSSSTRRWAGSDGEEVAQAAVEFPASTHPKRAVYTNTAAGFSFEYPKHWKKEELSSANMPVKFSARHSASTRPRKSLRQAHLESENEPSVVVCVEKAQEDMTLSKSIKAINKRFGSDSVMRAPQDVNLFHHEGDKSVQAKLVCHCVPFEVGGVASRFWQWTLVVLHARKSISIQYVVPEKVKDSFSAEAKAFTTGLCRSVYIADTSLRLDLQNADIARASEPKYGLSFSYPSTWSQAFFPTPGVVARLTEKDEDDEENPSTVVTLRSVPIREGASSVDLLRSVRDCVLVDEECPSLEWICREKPVTMGAFDGTQCSCFVTSEKDHLMVLDVTCFVHNGRGFYWMFSCRESLRAEKDNIFNFILDSMEVNPPETSLENPAEQDVDLKFIHSVRGLSVELPGSWGLSVETGTSSIVQAFTNHSAETAATELHSQLFMHQVHLPDKVSNLQEFKDHLLQQTRRQFPDTLTEGAVRNTFMNGCDAVQFEAAATVQGAFCIHMLFVCCIFDEKGWYAQFACLEELWDGLQDTIQKAVESVQIKTSKEVEAEASKRASEGISRGASSSSAGTVSGRR